MSRWRFLALERPRRQSKFRLRDRIFCSLGLALGVFFLILSWGLIAPVEDLVKSRILGTLPDRIQVSKRAVSVGPLAFGGALEATTVEALSALPQVTAVYRQAHYPDPCQLRARYAGEGLVTDLVLELVDPGQVQHEVAAGYQFSDPGAGQPLPALVPRAILDLVNSGIAVNTKLPQITESAILGKHFDLYLGTSSFRPGASQQVRCVIVGVSDSIGAGGPAIPYEAGARLSRNAPILHALTLQLESPQSAPAVSKEVEEMGLRVPRQELASKVSSVAFILKLFGSLLPLAVLSVTALALGSVLELQVLRERSLVALYRALGATRKQIAILYLVRALSVSVLSLALGFTASGLAGLGLARYLESRLPAELLQGQSMFAPPLVSFLLATGFCLGLTLLAGWYPAQSAAKLDPAQVFREPG